MHTWSSFADDENQELLDHVIDSHGSIPIVTTSTDSNSEPEHTGESKQKLYKNSRITVTESMLVVTAFAMRFRLSGEAIANLLEVIELHCPPENLCTTSYKKYQTFFNRFKQPITHHNYCSSCSGYLGDDQEVQQCKFCKKCTISSFVSIPVKDQLTEILASKYSYMFLHRVTSVYCIHSCCYCIN